MVASIVWFLLRMAGVPRRWAILVLIPAVFSYAWITGGSPPAMRSAWMTAVFLGAFGLRRQGDLLNSLGAVLLLNVLWDGRVLFQPGVQLSYGVVAAIAVGVGITGRWFQPIAEPARYLPVGLASRRQAFLQKMKRKLAQYLAVSTAAWAGSTPLTIWHFGIATPVSILAGLPVLPMVYGLLVVGLVSTALHPVLPPVSRRLNQLNGHLADGTSWMAAKFSRLPGGHFPVKRDPGSFLLIYDLKYGAGAACFSSGHGGGVLIDAGSDDSFRFVITPSLRDLGVTPDSVVFTHPDGGHFGGGEKIWEAFPIRQAVMPVARSRSPAFKVWQTQAPGAGVRLIDAGKNMRLTVGDDAWLEVVHRPDPLAVNAEADERVCVFRLHWRGWKILLTGDAGTDAEMAMVASGADLSADAIICGRPKHDTNLSDEFLQAVSPQVIVASNAAYPRHERLPAKQVDYWKSQGIHVVDQLRTGGVTIRLDEKERLVFTGFVDGSTVVISRRR